MSDIPEAAIAMIVDECCSRLSSATYKNELITILSVVITVIAGFITSLIITIINNRAASRLKKIETVLSARLEAYSAYLPAITQYLNDRDMAKYYAVHNNAYFVAGSDVRKKMVDLLPMIASYKGCGKEDAVDLLEAHRGVVEAMRVETSIETKYRKAGLQTVQRPNDNCATEQNYNR